MTQLTDLLARHKPVPVELTGEMQDVADMSYEAGKDTWFVCAATIAAAPDLVVTEAILREAFAVIDPCLAPHIDQCDVPILKWDGFRAAFQLLADAGWFKMEG